MNERVTEDIVRTHFRRWLSEKDALWEQIPDNARIRKCLNSASKQGGGKGRPEFIIAPARWPDFLIVVECKANTAHHDSGGNNDAQKFAVDGVLHYARYLSAEFNVLAIAVSGAPPAPRISHFWMFKGEKKGESCFGSELLPLADYCQAYVDHGKVFNQDLNELLTYTKKLNDTLHGAKIKESHRSLLISAVLMALQDEGFRTAYPKVGDAQILLQNIKNIMIRSMENASIKGQTLHGIKASYAFMDDARELKRDRILWDLVDEIHKRLHNFQKNHEYHDILGRLYVEFLRYSNSDKGLGIVLTPPHITELAVSLAHVGKDDVLYDNCAGTGGFLIAGMKEMMRDAAGDRAQENKIKAKGLVGVETQGDIASLLCSNMFIHGDGKSNVFQDDCLTAEITSKIRQDFRPTIGFLNPPFKGVPADHEEFAFVLNNLSVLQPKGTCVALLPMQCALAQRGTRAALKAQLLEKHTLEAVLSLPGDIFHNSKVGVVTCLMIFTAHQPHPAGKKTWFAYCKDDGFVKRKPQGRIDHFNRWQDIKTQWTQGYHNKETIPDFSVMREVGVNDEWCVEAYLEPDYSRIVQKDFAHAVLDYAIFRLREEKLREMITPASDKFQALAKTPAIAADTSFDYIRHMHQSNSPQTVTLPHTDQWQWFYLRDLFQITGSQTTSLDDLTAFGAGPWPYVTTQSDNNGVEGYYNYFTESGGVIAVDSAVLGFASYQAKNFSASDHVEKLIPQMPLSKYAAIFITALLNKQQFRYNYGRKCSQVRLTRQQIKLPADKDGKPNFVLMENYIKSLPFSAAI